MPEGMRDLGGGHRAWWATPSEGEGPWPGLLLLHDAWGLNGPNQAEAEAWAEQGFAVLALACLPPRLPPEAPHPASAWATQDLPQGWAAAQAALAEWPEARAPWAWVAWGEGAAWASLQAAQAPALWRAGVAHDALGATPPQGVCPTLLQVGGADPRWPHAVCGAWREAWAAAGGRLLRHEGIGAGFADPTRHEGFGVPQALAARQASLAWLRGPA